MSLQDKVIVVTGAAQGLGESYARRFAADGAQVGLADLSAEKAAAVAAAIRADGGAAQAFPVDVADEASTLGLAAAVVDRFGRVDHLVNNAGIHSGLRMEPMLTVDFEYYRHVMAVNLDGAYLCTRAFHRQLAERHGAVVNHSSTVSWLAGGYYSLSKAALNSLTACLAAELGPLGVRINAIAPGVTDTEATRSMVSDRGLEKMIRILPLARLGRPDDMYGVCKFLLSDEAAWITGQVLAVDGGRVVRL
jgi:NAD(P)-dependent dehydrogenase (short-subunit alcohol dehydrogenase family)